MILAKIFGANWKPRITGILAGTLYSTVSAWEDGTLVFTPKHITAFIVMTALGYVMKGNNVTGIGEKATTDPAKDATKPTSIAEMNGGTTIAKP